MVEGEDTEAQFIRVGPDAPVARTQKKKRTTKKKEAPVADRELRAQALRESWDGKHERQHVDDSKWISDLAQYLTYLVDLRTARVDKWLKSNTQRFQAGNASIEELRRTFDSAVVDLRASVQICRSQCAGCKLFCVRSHLHEGGHDCMTNHECVHECTFCQLLTANPCGQT